MKKIFDIKTDKWQWKMRKRLHKMISRNMRNCDILVQNLNCHAKESAMEGSDFQGHEKQEMS
jgi:hypothetical protein